jgi:hypothetical protein
MASTDKKYRWPELNELEPLITKHVEAERKAKLLSAGVDGAKVIEDVKTSRQEIDALLSRLDKFYAQHSEPKPAEVAA